MTPAQRRKRKIQIWRRSLTSRFTLSMVIMWVGIVVMTWGLALTNMTIAAVVLGVAFIVYALVFIDVDPPSARLRR